MFTQSHVIHRTAPEDEELEAYVFLSDDTGREAHEAAAHISPEIRMRSWSFPGPGTVAMTLAGQRKYYRTSASHCRHPPLRVRAALPAGTAASIVLISIAPVETAFTIEDALAVCAAK